MRLQSSTASCGLAAISNALSCLGISRSEEELVTLTGYSAPDGTQEKGILKALAAIAKSEPAAGIQPAQVYETRADVAMLRLVEGLRHGRPAILCVDEWDHWVVAFGLLGQSIHVADSADNALVITYSPGGLIDRWRNPSKRKNFYGIIL